MSIAVDPEVGVRNQLRSDGRRRQNPHRHHRFLSEAAYEGVPIPLLMDGCLVQPRISVDQPAAGSATQACGHSALPSR